MKMVQNRQVLSPLATPAGSLRWGQGNRIWVETVKAVLRELEHEGARVNLFPQLA
jgi:hypothetical protein